MTRSILSVLSLLGLVGCNNPDCSSCDTTEAGQDLDGDGVCDNCEDSDVWIGDQYATINVTATFLTKPVDSVVMVDESEAGNTGQDIDITAEHTHQIGVGVMNELGLYIYTLDESWAGDPTWAGASIITPSWDVKLDPGAVDKRDEAFSLYPFHANDYWTCLNDKNSSIGIGILETDGANIYVPGGPGLMTISGVTMTKDGYPDASFTSTTSASYTTSHPDGDIHSTCFPSDAEGNLTSPPEE